MIKQAVFIDSIRLGGRGKEWLDKVLKRFQILCHVNDTLIIKEKLGKPWILYRHDKQYSRAGIKTILLGQLTY